MLGTITSRRSDDERADEWGAALWSSATRRVDGASLAVVRIAFGTIGLLSAIRLVARGWVGSLLVDPSHHLRYPGLGWVPVPPGWAIHALVLVVALASLSILLGWHHRAATITFVAAFGWLESIEVTIYLNHYWFMTIAGALMVLLPMSATWSLDARRRGRRSVPAGSVWLLRAQIGVVYVVAGLAKLHGDWLVHGLPLGLWLPAREHLAVAEPLLGEHTVALAASWAGAVFDCTVVGFLLWRRTRLGAWLVAVTFHLVTWWLFPIIGVFPWLMIAASTVFFDPDWPVVVARRLGLRSMPTGGSTPERSWWRRHPRSTVAVVVVWASVQVLLPLRHLAYPGDHRWSGQGFRFGWNVMLVEKAGLATFRLTDPRTGREWTDDASDLLTLQQRRAMATDPELVRQTAHLLARSTETASGSRPEVRVDAVVSLNGRPAAPLIDPSVDLAAEPWRLGPQPWILPVPTTPPPR